MIREETSKLNQIIRDMKLSLTDDRVLMSGEKNNPLIMSPFERKIASYQKSAELRKERSGSRGRPVPVSSGMNNTGSNLYQR